MVRGAAEPSRQRFTAPTVISPPVQDSLELGHDAQVRANGHIAEITDADGVTRELVVNPVQFDETPAEIRRAPQFAEHTDELLRELGVDDERMLALKISGAVT